MIDEQSDGPKRGIGRFLMETLLAPARSSGTLPNKDMQYVSSRGGPRVMLPTSDICRWIDNVGDSNSPGDGIFGLACSIDRYCGVISPWVTQLVIFGDDPSDIYYYENHYDGLLVRWVGADSLDRLSGYAIAEAAKDAWDETTEVEIVDKDMTIMDTCTFRDDKTPRIRLSMRIGTYRVCSRYAENSDIMAIIHRLEYLG